MGVRGFVWARACAFRIFFCAVSLPLAVYFRPLVCLLLIVIGLCIQYTVIIITFINIMEESGRKFLRLQRRGGPTN